MHRLQQSGQHYRKTELPLLGFLQSGVDDEAHAQQRELEQMFASRFVII